MCIYTTSTVVDTEMEGVMNSTTFFLRNDEMVKFQNEAGNQEELAFRFMSIVLPTLRKPPRFFSGRGFSSLLKLPEALLVRFQTICVVS